MASLFLDKDIERLEKIKELLKEIKEIDDRFSLSNIIEIDNNTTLLFSTEAILKQCDAFNIELLLENKLGCKCVIINRAFKLEKALKEDKEYD